MTESRAAAQVETLSAASAQEVEGLQNVYALGSITVSRTHMHLKRMS